MFSRYLVLIEDRGKVYAFDRDNNCFLLPNLSFPHPTENRHIKNTLVDAEMIIEELDNGKKMPRLLIYDVITYEVVVYLQCVVHKIKNGCHLTFEWRRRGLLFEQLLGFHKNVQDHF